MSIYIAFESPVSFITCNRVIQLAVSRILFLLIFLIFSMGEMAFDPISYTYVPTAPRSKSTNTLRKPVP